jgi:hypothetical protein
MAMASYKVYAIALAAICAVATLATGVGAGVPFSRNVFNRHKQPPTNSPYQSNAPATSPWYIFDRYAQTQQQSKHLKEVPPRDNFYVSTIYLLCSDYQVQKTTSIHQENF